MGAKTFYCYTDVQYWFIRTDTSISTDILTCELNFCSAKGIRHSRLTDTSVLFASTDTHFFCFLVVCLKSIGIKMTSNLVIRMPLTKSLHSPEEVASGPRILCWVMFFHYLSLASLNGLVL